MYRWNWQPPGPDEAQDKMLAYARQLPPSEALAWLIRNDPDIREDFGHLLPATLEASKPSIHAPELPVATSAPSETKVTATQDACKPLIFASPTLPAVTSTTGEPKPAVTSSTGEPKVVEPATEVRSRSHQRLGLFNPSF